MKKYLPISLLLATLLLGAIGITCVQPPDYPVEPVIAFQQTTPALIFQRPFWSNPDTVYTDLIFTFTDGDGDIGFDDEASVVVKDLRVPNVPKDYILPKVPEQGAGNGISGEVRLRVPVSCCIPDPVNGIPLPACDSTNQQLRDTIVYSIQIKDRAGNWSNTIESAPIILRCRRQ
jgi:hypothetical protein